MQGHFVTNKCKVIQYILLLGLNRILAKHLKLNWSI